MDVQLHKQEKSFVHATLLVYLYSIIISMNELIDVSSRGVMDVYGPPKVSGQNENGDHLQWQSRPLA
jgi:hypothetical protein